MLRTTGFAGFGCFVPTNAEIGTFFFVLLIKRLQRKCIFSCLWVIVFALFCVIYMETNIQTTGH